MYQLSFPNSLPPSVETYKKKKGKKYDGFFIESNYCSVAATTVPGDLLLTLSVLLRTLKRKRFIDNMRG